MLCLRAEQGHIEDNIISIPLRLQFPYCRTDVKYQTRILRPKAIDLFHQENFLSKLPYQPINSWEESWDVSFLNEPIPLYRSSKNMTDPELINNHIYPRIDTFPWHGGEYEFKNFFRPHQHLHVIQGLVNPQIFDYGERDLGYLYYYRFIIVK